jgi:ABC-2 type transport system permease protein
VVLVPAAAISVVADLAIAGAPVASAWGDTLAAVALVSAYVLCWLSIVAAAVARGEGAVGAIATVAGLLLMLAVAIPVTASAIFRRVAPPPSAVDDVNARRDAVDAVQGSMRLVVSRGLTDGLGARADELDPMSLDYSTRLSPVTEELERRLQGRADARQTHRRLSATVEAALGWVSPSVAMHAALTDLAGTGQSRHQAFLDDTREFQLSLRRFMYPRVLQAALQPASRCEGCRARMVFTDFDAIPTFAALPLGPRERLATALTTALWLLVLAIGVLVLSFQRLSSWGFGNST